MRKLTARPGDRIVARKRKRRTGPAVRWSALSKRATRSGKTARRPTRKKSGANWRSLPWRAIAVAGVAAVLISATVQLWSSGRITSAWIWAGEQTLALTADAGFVVDDILVEGRARTPTADLLAALGIEHGAPILGFDPESARVRLEEIDWIETASVERRLPNVVYLHVIEREPVALWQNGGTVVLIDAKGAAIQTTALENFSNLLLVVGSTAPVALPELLTLIDDTPGLKGRVEAAVRVGDRRWDLKLDNGVDVNLPEVGAADALARLAEIEKSHAIMDGGVATIDLRVTGKLYVQPSSDEAESGDGAGILLPQAVTSEERV